MSNLNTPLVSPVESAMDPSSFQQLYHVKTRNIHDNEEAFEHVYVKAFDVNDALRTVQLTLNDKGRAVHDVLRPGIDGFGIEE